MHQNRIIWSELDCLIYNGRHKVRNNPSYANGTTFVRSHINKIMQNKRRLPAMLKENKRLINKNKIEKLKVKYQESNS